MVDCGEETGVETMPERCDEPPATPSSRGNEILASLQSILARCRDAEPQLAYPGEGGERPFRGWLVADFLARVLGWPSEKTPLGERFDIRLLDSNNHVVATIETKAPEETISAKDREDFEERLGGYASLQVAYITNGTIWERVDLLAPEGIPTVRGRDALDLERASPEHVEAFFAPLAVDRYVAGSPQSSRHRVNKDSPHILRALAADLDQAIGDLAIFLERLHPGLSEGLAGEHARSVTRSLFERWCGQSLVVSPTRTAKELVQTFENGDPSTSEVTKLLMDLGVPGSEASAAAEAVLSLPKESRLDETSLAEALWRAFVPAIRKLCAQTAHVVVARALLYRIGEDEDIFTRWLSGKPLERALAAKPTPVKGEPKPATELLSRVREHMQDFLPAVYRSGEFDWWLVPADKRPALKGDERAWLRGMDAAFELALQRVLRVLNSYFFGDVDVDVWRNVYQDYLPAEERQRLGGFYTPDELVGLVLDLADFKPETDALCRLSFIDPACGSGAFVTTALARLLAHLELDLPCHSELRRRGVPEWRQAEAILRLVAERLHAVDLHPFAAFLTTVNVLFLLMPLYVKAREKNPGFTLQLEVFSADSLEKHDEDLRVPDMFTKLNSRVQLAEESFRRYQAMVKLRFDRVFGNPPWGGVLKGSLAPIYDDQKKRRFADEYVAAARGKYDVYGLFMERALLMLKKGGRFGLVTQGTFIDKEWAAGLREMLASRAELQFVVDLNPFGQLFFKAMNTPCITVADAPGERPRRKEAITVISSPPTDLSTSDDPRRQVVATVMSATEAAARGRKPVTMGFARASPIPLERLRATAAEGWDLGGSEALPAVPEGWPTAADLFEARQGVTPGGCLDVFLMTADEARARGLEAELIHHAIKTREIERWRVRWSGRVLLYPYRWNGHDAKPAFRLVPAEVLDPALGETLRRLRVEDALDFDKCLDRREEEIVRRRGVNAESVGELLNHRIALGIVKYQAVARYLVEHYERLESRVFEKRRFKELGKQWYEYHRPRDPNLMLSRTRIVSPTLLRRVRFSLDTEGYLSDHACLFLQPTAKTRARFLKFRGQLADVLGGHVSLESTLKYCLAFLNSNEAQERLVRGQRPTPKGSYAVTEAALRRLPIPPPGKKKGVKSIIDLVGRLIKTAEQESTQELEEQLAKLVDSMLAG